MSRAQWQKLVPRFSRSPSSLFPLIKQVAQAQTFALAISPPRLKHTMPLLGVVHAPVTPDRGADRIAWAEGLPHLMRNGQPVVNDLSQQRLGDLAVVMMSAAAEAKPQLNAELCAPAQFHAVPSIAYRLARVAAGDAACAVDLLLATPGVSNCLPVPEWSPTLRSKRTKTLSHKRPKVPRCFPRKTAPKAVAVMNIHNIAHDLT